MQASYAIETRELTKIYGKDLYAVKNLTLKIEHGVTYGLLGPNGAGKTTTIRMLNCIIKPTSGTALVDGNDIEKKSLQVKSITGFLPESPSIYEKLSALEFLEFIGDLYSVPSTALHERISNLIDLFDLEGRENDLLEGYSRGMKQKVCLMSALIHDPDIIFLDEPTSNLDPEMSYKVRDLILHLAKKASKTILIATHLLRHAEDLCDKIGIIKEGELLIEGTPQEIIKKTETKNLEQAYLKIMGHVHEADLQKLNFK